MNKKTALTVDIKASDLPEVKEIIKNQQSLIESQARILEGFISDMEDIKARLDGVREDIKTARDTVILEDHDECIYNAIDLLNYIIDFVLAR